MIVERIRPKCTIIEKGSAGNKRAPKGALIRLTNPIGKAREVQ